MSRNDARHAVGISDRASNAELADEARDADRRWCRREWFADRLERLGDDGVYIDREPPTMQKEDAGVRPAREHGAYSVLIR